MSKSLKIYLKKNFFFRRNNSLLDTTGKESKNNSQTRLWLVGNKIIQITTGLFSNICIEEPSSLLTRKNRLTKTSGNSTSAGKSSSKARTSPAIDIPTNQNSTSTLNPVQINDSIASSNNSSASMSVNNSYSSVSLTSNCHITTPTNLDPCEKLKNSEKFADSCSLNSLNACTKSEQDFFDETIDNPEPVKENEIESLEKIQKPLNDDSNRRNRLLKRRYKSGLPLTSDRNEDDSIEEAYLKNFSENANQRQSKDDSAINSDLDLAPPFCCLKSSEDRRNKLNRVCNHQHHHHHHHHHKKHYCNNEEMIKNKLDYFYKNQQIPDSTEKTKEICHPSCWCNNLVEITCRYPTKVVTYVSLIESNFSNSHGINLSCFDQILKINALSTNQDSSFSADESNKEPGEAAKSAYPLNVAAASKFFTKL